MTDDLIARAKAAMADVTAYDGDKCLCVRCGDHEAEIVSGREEICWDCHNAPLAFLAPDLIAAIEARDARIADLEQAVLEKQELADEFCAMHEAAEARVKVLEGALRNIRELNMTGTDEDGHRWAHSDLIEQEIVRAALEGEK